MKKYSILMYNFNNYEIMREPQEIDDECEYIYVTDNEKLKSDNWKIIVDHDLDGLSPFDKCYRVRFNLFKYATTPVCIYVDGSIQIHKSLRKLFDDFMNSGADVGLNIHPYRDNLKDEYEMWIKIRNYPRKNFEKCKCFFNAAKYDINQKGLYQGSVRICKNTELNKEIDSNVFLSLVELGKDENKIERLDQTIYSFIINYLYKDIKIFPFAQQVFQSKYMSWCQHGTNCIHKYTNVNKTGYVQGKLTDLYFI